MNRRLKKSFKGIFFLSLLCTTTLATSLWANPSDNVTSDQPLYQRVKALEAYGLLDPQDQAVLDQGRVVTKLELGFFTEKAKANYQTSKELQVALAPQAASTTDLTANPAPAAAVTVATPAQNQDFVQGFSLYQQKQYAQAIPKFQAVIQQNPNIAMAYYYLGYCQVMAGKTKEGAVALTQFIQKQPNPSIRDYLTRVKARLTQAEQQWVDAQVGSASIPAQPANTDIETEINALLKILDEESDYLRTRMALLDYRLQDQEKELETLQSTQDDINSIFRKSNKSSTSPHFIYEADVKAENFHLSGITIVSATAVANDFTLGVWSDLGGKGSYTVNLQSTLQSSNATSAPASLYISAPSLNYNLDGMLGHWSSTIAVESYTWDTDYGDFTRGGAANALRFEDPFDVKRYSGDKNQKTWDDYMTNLGYVPSSTSWITQNQTTKVFDGLYMVGTSLPLVSKDAKMNMLFGRVDGDTHQWEEGIKYAQPWANGFLLSSLSALWVNDNGLSAPLTQGNMDMKSYAADLGFDLKPAFLDIEGGYTHLYTGVYNDGGPVSFHSGNIALAQTLSAPAGQAALSLYPLTLYYTAISEQYSNFQSKVLLTGIQFWKFGFPANTNNNNPVMNDQFGFVGMADDLISDRYGWRATLGWKGRQESWTKSLPSFLDDLIINMDVARKTEYQAVSDEMGYKSVEAYNLISVFYPESTGIFGSNVWDGYQGMHPAGAAYVSNIESSRGDGNTFNPDVIRFGPPIAERVPLILNYIPGSQSVTSPDNGVTFTSLDHIKTFNYATVTAKLQLNKMLGLNTPFYAGLFFTDNEVSGDTNNPTLANVADPNRPGQTLAHIPCLFDQTVYDAAFMYGIFKWVNLLADYGLEQWKSNYTIPKVDYRTDSLGAGMAYDFPWGGGKLEMRYKHVTFRDLYVSANSYQADQVYSMFIFSF